MNSKLIVIVGLIIAILLLSGCTEEEPVDKKTWLLDHHYVPLDDIHGVKSNWIGSSIKFDMKKMNITAASNDTIVSINLPIDFHIICITDYEMDGSGVTYVKYQGILPTKKIYDNLKAHVYYGDTEYIVGLHTITRFVFDATNCPLLFPLTNNTLSFDVQLVLDIPEGFEVDYYFNPFGEVVR